MKRVFGAVAGILLAASGALASDMKTAAQATFKIYDGNQGMCSATFYRNDPAGALFITAGHCVIDKGDYNLREQNAVIGADGMDYETLSEQVYYVKAVKTLKAEDVALIQVKDKAITFDVKPVDFATAADLQQLEVGSPIMAVGYPAGGELTVSKGEFTGQVPGLPSIDVKGPLYRTTATVIGGNSGGGFYMEVNGDYKYLGTVNAIANPAYGAGLLNWGTVPATIDKLLTGFKDNGKSAAETKPKLPTAGSIDGR